MRRFGNMTGFGDSTRYVEYCNGMATAISIYGGRMHLEWLPLKTIEAWIAMGDWLEFQESKAFTIWTEEKRLKLSGNMRVIDIQPPLDHDNIESTYGQ